MFKSQTASKVLNVVIYQLDPGHPAYAKIPTRVTIDIDCHIPLTRVALVADILRLQEKMGIAETENHDTAVSHSLLHAQNICPEAHK